MPGSSEPEEGTTTHWSGAISSRAISAFRSSIIAAYASDMAICNDRRWPETYRMLCLNGAEIALIGYKHAAAARRGAALAHLRMFHNICRCRPAPISNTLWVAAAAKAGFEDGQALIGGSLHHRTDREIAAQALSLGDEVIVHRADLDLDRDLPEGELRLRPLSSPGPYRLIAEQV